MVQVRMMHTNDCILFSDVTIALVIAVVRLHGKMFSC
jgi:hypothetical protein